MKTPDFKPSPARNAPDMGETEGGVPGIPVEAKEATGPDARLGAFLRTHSPSPALRNDSFFNQSILDRIDPHPTQPVPEQALGRSWFLPPRRLLWIAAGAAAMLAMMIGFIGMDSNPGSQPAPRFSRIISAQPGDESITAVPFVSRDQRVAVLWLEGLKYIPEPEPPAHVN